MSTMSNQIPKLEELRDRAKQRLEEIRNKFQIGSIRSQPIGEGSVFNKMRSRADRITARIQERKPGLLPMVNEFKPGQRVKKILTPQTQVSKQPPTRPILKRLRDEISINT